MATHSGVLAWRIPMDRGALRATVHGVKKELDMTEQLSTSSKQTMKVEESCCFWRKFRK